MNILETHAVYFKKKRVRLEIKKNQKMRTKNKYTIDVIQMFCDLYVLISMWSQNLMHPHLWVQDDVGLVDLDVGRNYMASVCSCMNICLIMFM